MTKSFELNLALVLAHTLLFNTREEYGNTKAVNFGGDQPAPSTGDSMDSILAAYQKHFPGLIKSTADGILPVQTAQLNAQQTLSPAYAKLMQGLYETYGPAFNKVGNDIAAQNKESAAASDLSVLKGSGGQLADQAQAIDRRLNPEFYATRANMAKGYGDIINQLNPIDVNPAAERAVNREAVRSGNVGNSGTTTTVGNALRFSDEADKRAGALGNALASATAFLGGSKTSFDPFGRQVNNTNSGESKFTGISDAHQGDSALSLGGNLLNNTTSIRNQENQINSQRRDTLDRVNETMSSLPNVSC